MTTLFSTILPAEGPMVGTIAYMAHSVLYPEPPLGRATEKKIALLKLLGIPLILGLALLVFASFLWRVVPNWVGFVAMIAECTVAAFVIKKIRLLRNRDKS